MNIKTTIKLIIKNLANLLFPRVCTSCGAIAFKGRYNTICPNCVKNIAYNTGGRCLQCGEILGANNMPNITKCPKCAEMNIAYKEVLCITVFSGTIVDAIHALKYKNAPYIAKDLAQLALLHPETKAFLQDATLVAVPLSISRKIKRGYNQAEEIALEITKRTKHLNTQHAKLLKRTRSTSTQTKLDRSQRMQNIAKAFATTKICDTIDKNQKIVIIDDVITTASTINECAKVLKKAGFKNIFAFSIAKRM